MSFWLMKSEPEVFSIEDLRKKKVSGWDGVRNYQARNFMRAMKKGDLAFFYHSNAQPPGVAGVMEVAREAYADATQFDPKDGHFDGKASPGAPIWFHVDVRWLESFPRLVPLDELRGMPELSGMTLFKRSRLSVQPVEEAQWKAIVRAGRKKA